MEFDFTGLVVEVRPFNRQPELLAMIGSDMAARSGSPSTCESRLQTTTRGLGYPLRHSPCVASSGVSSEAGDPGRSATIRPAKPGRPVTGLLRLWRSCEVTDHGVRQEKESESAETVCQVETNESFVRRGTKSECAHKDHANRIPESPGDVRPMSYGR